MAEKLIILARDFALHPGPRFVSQGPNSGEKFRKFLTKSLAVNDKITVDLDGTSGIGSSFLDEAFGGLVFAEGLSAEEVRRRVKIISRLDSSYLVLFDDALNRASRKTSALATAVHVS